VRAEPGLGGQAPVLGLAVARHGHEGRFPDREIGAHRARERVATSAMPVGGHTTVTWGATNARLSPNRAAPK
jgi:hypothetical protein